MRVKVAAIAIFIILFLFYVSRGPIALREGAAGGVVLLSGHTPIALREGMAVKRRCPDLLIQKGNRIYLHNTKLAIVPGVNPISFENLEEYTQFVQWQQTQGIDCPVLFLQQGMGAQGDMEYTIRHDINDPRGGLMRSVSHLGNLPPVTLLTDAGRDDPPYNQNSYPSFDPENQDIGKFTPLDKMFHEQENRPKSDFATDSNWGGKAYTKYSVDQGFYDENQVYRYKNKEI